MSSDNEIPVHIQAELIRQEHRAVRLWINFIEYYLRGDKHSADPRRKAALEAFLWSLLVLDMHWQLEPE